ncbi:MAG: Rid family hydrolase [Melioribacteraceae bacterium]|nr:Rid family hydrolase [Melioribacteraceae bacterium]
MTSLSDIIVLHSNQKSSVHNETLDVFRQAVKYFPKIVRMWVFLKDIDNNYRDFSHARNQIYWENGIRDRSFVSTCVGCDDLTEDRHLCLKLLLSDQLGEANVTYMDLFSHLPHTRTYGVSFERGAVFDYGHVKHYHISGTASISINGQVLYGGDVVKQTERVFEIIKALLTKYGATKDDIISVICYVRNKDHIPFVKKAIRETDLNLNKINLTVEEAKICRPNWLVEAECFALTIA